MMGPITTMKYLIFSINILILLEFCFAQDSIENLPVQSPNVPQEVTLDLISKGLTEFTLGLDRAISQENSNGKDYFVVSPACLQISLAMILLASNGKTFDEVSKVLGLEGATNFSQNSEIFHHVLSEAIKNYEREQSLDSSLPLVNFASGIFVQNEFPLLDQFKSASEQLYNSEVEHLDFGGDSLKVKDFVNDWVKNKTLNKIQEALSSPPGRDTLAILLSTLYFKGEWDEPFNRAFSRLPFYVGPDEIVDVDMVKQSNEFLHYTDQELGFQIVGLPYQGSDTLMYIILPEVPGKAGLAELKSRLTAEKIDEVLNLMEYERLQVYLPKMTLSSSQSLKDALISLGLSTLFSSTDADLSLLTATSEDADTVSETYSRQQSDDSDPQLKLELGSPPPTEESENGLNQDQPKPPFRIIVPNNPIYDVENPSSWTQADSEPKDHLEQETSEVFVYEDPQLSHYDVSGPKSHVTQDIVKYYAPIVKARCKRDGSGRPSLGLDALRNHQKLENLGLYLSNLFHAVEISVDELGTEAAASSIGVVAFRSAEPRSFKVNQPFLFFIRQNSTKSILFWGSVNKPSPSYPYKPMETFN